MPTITGKFAQQLRDVVFQYERRNQGNPLPLTRFEQEFASLVHHPLTRRPGQKLSALLADVQGLQTCFADPANPQLMFVRTVSYRPENSNRHGHRHNGGSYNRYPCFPPFDSSNRSQQQQQQLVVRDNRNRITRDTRNPLLLVKLLVESHGHKGMPLASLEKVFEQKYGQPFPRPPTMKLAHFVDQVVRGVESYHPQPGKPHKFVRPTSSSYVLAKKPPRNFQHQQCFVEEEVITETFEEVAGPETIKPVNVDTVLCVDTSSSMAGRRITEACAGVAGVCTALAKRACAGDTLSLIGFGSKTHDMQPRQLVATVDASHLQAQLRAAVGGCTALLDAIARGVISAKTRPGSAGKDDACFAEVMVLTDGNENNSKVNQSELRKLLLATGTKRHSEDGRHLVHVTLVYVGSSSSGRAQLDELAKGLEHVTVKAYKDSQGGIAKAFSGFVTAMASRTVRCVRTTKKVRRMVTDATARKGVSNANDKQFCKPMQHMNQRR
eukprot:INCI5552.1.p1 GENE.INCI5552.1~~INCI5552.1.p1  ORF type:complete len:495 (+),score=91.65 INCI5552.1:92-1576(+)